MGLLFWKNNKNIDIFANQLANEFYSFVQPKAVITYFQSTLSKDKDGKKIKKMVETNLSSLVKQIKQFYTINHLGTYGKARLQLKFNERMKELGYDKATVEKISEYILLNS